MNVHRARIASGDRRGSALVFVLILLLFLSMLGITLARLVIAQHRQRLQDELQAQTVRLADAGWNRAHANLARNPNYTGEVWQFDAGVLGPDRAAAVRIEVVPSEADPARRQLQITAEYPVGSPEVHRVSREGVVMKP